MADIISVLGAPGSGQTTVGFKVACEIYDIKKSNKIAYVSMNSVIPVAGVLFPNLQSKDIVSVSGLLDKIEMNVENVLSHMINPPNMKNFGFLGLVAGESKSSYPIPDRGKIEKLYKTLQNEFDYIIVDYEHGEELSRYALTNSDRIIRVVAPDIKSAVWKTSARTLINDDDARLLNVINIINDDGFMPLEEIRSMFKNKIAATIPYSKALIQQTYDGKLWEHLGDKKYMKELHKLALKVIDPTGKGRDSRHEAIEESGFAE